jgi:hypothetical protein
MLITAPKQRSEALGLLLRQWRCLIDNFADVIFKLGGTKITLGVGDNRIIGVSVAFECVVPRSGGVHGLQIEPRSGCVKTPSAGRVRTAGLSHHGGQPCRKFLTCKAILAVGVCESPNAR